MKLITDNYNFFTDQRFKVIAGNLDYKMGAIATLGKNIPVKQADIITAEQEAYLWNNNFLGSDSGEKLLRTFVFVFGVNFALGPTRWMRTCWIGF